jgi:hypothetical protein
MKMVILPERHKKKIVVSRFKLLERGDKINSMQPFIFSQVEQILNSSFRHLKNAI